MSYKYDQEKIKKTLINRYCKITHSQVVRVERRNLESMGKLVYPYWIGMYKGYKPSMMLGHITTENNMLHVASFRLGDYIIKDFIGNVKVVDAKTMVYLCQGID